MASSVNPTVLCLTGPESTGKSTLAAQLAADLDAPLVFEYAREYLQPETADTKGPGYTEADLCNIAQGQRSLENAQRSLEKAQRSVDKAQQPHPWLVCDTDIQVIETWWWFKFGPGLRPTTGRVTPTIETYPSWLQQAVVDRSPRHYLLMATDIEWVADPLREDPDNRLVLFNHYLSLMLRDNLSYRVIHGQGPGRRRNAHLAIQALTGYRLGQSSE